MTPEEKVKAYFYMNGRDVADRELFDAIIHEDVVQIDSPVNIRVEGKETMWAMMDVPAEQKQGPDTFAYSADFIEYIGGETNGLARWSFKPTGKFALLWGLDGVHLSEEEAPDIVIAIKVEFKDGKIILLDEYWNPVPLLQKFGLDIPTPALPG